MENQTIFEQRQIPINQEEIHVARKKKILVLVIVTGILISTLMVLLYLNGRHILDSMTDTTTNTLPKA